MKLILYKLLSKQLVLLVDLFEVQVHFKQDIVPEKKRLSRFLMAEVPLKLPSTEVRCRKNRAGNNQQQGKKRKTIKYKCSQLAFYVILHLQRKMFTTFGASNVQL